MSKYKAGDDIISYLDKYRVQIEIRKYTEREACVLLHQLLPEELVTVIECLPEDQRHKLDSVSEHLISAAGYKPENFCQQYYQAKPNEYDNMYRFALRQLQNFHLWIESHQVAGEYQAFTRGGGGGVERPPPPQNFWKSVFSMTILFIELYLQS